MKSFLYVAPVVLAQTWDQPPLTLYNNANPRNANCAVKTSACDCHYASCSLTGDCVCGWDDASQTCQSGIPTKCVSCPAMRRCSVAEKLKIGPNGFPIPGQLSVWGQVPYPDQSGPSNSNSGIVQGQAQAQLQPLTQFQQPSNQFQYQQPQYQQPQYQQSQYQQPQYQQPQQPQYQQPQYQQPQYQQTQYQPIQAQPQYQTLQSQYQQQVQYQQPTPSPILQSQSSAQFSGEPLTLYQNNVLSAGGCAAKTNACDCHYASCTATGDCACGWDASSQTCRAGIPTQCVSCPSMSRCGVVEKLKIGPNGFPIPGQLSVWGQVPYPDQSNAASGQTSSQSLQFNSQPVQSNSQTAQSNSQTVQWNGQSMQMNSQMNSQPMQINTQPMQWSNQPVQLSSNQLGQSMELSGQPMLLGSQGFQLNSQPLQFSNSAPTPAPAAKPRAGKAKGVVGR